MSGSYCARRPVPVRHPLLRRIGEWLGIVEDHRYDPPPMRLEITHRGLPVVVSWYDGDGQPTVENLHEALCQMVIEAVEDGSMTPREIDNLRDLRDMIGSRTSKEADDE